MTPSSPVTYRSLLRTYLGPQRGSVIMMAVLLIAAIALEIAEPRIVAFFIESIQLGRAESTLVTIALVFLGVALVRQVTKVIAAYSSEKVSWTATNAMREDLSSHVLRLDLTFHESRSPGELIERVDGDVNEVAEFFSSLIVQLIGNALLVVGILIALVFVDWRIGLTFSVIMLGGYYLLGKVTAVATLKWEEDREQSARFFGYVSETIRATEDLRSSHAVGYALRRFHRRLRAWLPVKVRAEAWGSTIWMVLSLVFTASTAFAFGYGGFFYQNGTISLSSVYLIVAYATMLNTPIEILREQVQTLQQARAAVRRISELFAVQPTMRDGEGELPAGPLSVSFDAVDFEYVREERPSGGDSDSENTGAEDASVPAEVERNAPAGVDDPASSPPAGRRRVLSGLSFDVEAGTTLGLVGRTGAGKSTIAHLLFRMYDPVAGRVLLGGVDAREVTLASLRSRVGFVTQDTHVFTASLRDNLAFFDAEVPDEHLWEILDRLELREWVESLPDGLATQISRSMLSEGQAQLLSLGRVFLKDPGLVILDEPSSKLDLVTEAALERALDRLLAGRTVLVIAHRLDTIRRADQVLVLENGAVVERGATEKLLRDDDSRLAELFRVGEVRR